MQRNEVKQYLRDRLFQELGAGNLGRMDRAGVAAEVDRAVRRLKGVKLSEVDITHLCHELVDDLFGFGPIQPLLDDPTVTEVMVNGPNRVYAEREGNLAETDVHFDDESHLRGLIERYVRRVGRRVDESQPIVDFTLEDGSRVNVVVPPVAVGGPFLTIRRHYRRLTGLDALVGLNTLDVRMARFLWACVQSQANLLLSGATGSGKTTLLEVLSSYIGERERIVVIEDTPELVLRQRHVVTLQTRAKNTEERGEVTLRDLFVNSLRMRPNRIILGELRGAEAFDYLQAVTSGHRGSLAVIHAATPEEAVLRLENLVYFGLAQVPSNVVRRQIAQGVEIILQLDRLSDGTRKVTRISEVVGLSDDGFVAVNDLFLFEQQGRDADGHTIGKFRATGRIPHLAERFRLMGIDLKDEVFRAN